MRDYRSFQRFSSLFFFFLLYLLKTLYISRYVVFVAIYNPFIVQICISSDRYRLT